MVLIVLEPLNFQRGYGSGRITSKTRNVSSTLGIRVVLRNCNFKGEFPAVARQRSPIAGLSFERFRL